MSYCENFLNLIHPVFRQCIGDKKVRTIGGQPFSKAVELATRKETSNFWGAEYNTLITRAVKKKRGGTVALPPSLHIHSKRWRKGCDPSLLPEGVSELGQVRQPTNHREEGMA